DSVLSGKDMINGREVFVLDLTAKKKTASYYKRKLFVDTENHDVIRYELFALSGAKLKEFSLIKAERIGTRRFPVESEVRDMLRKGSSTRFVMNSVALDKPVADSVFSMSNLQK
ncbi:MAG: outer membrane lipoprotein-sorting protein, partial [Spirochaetaceae bacterium]|nr:outer membrane lipoprotein-sorting protein [Spirochaetaceae bacterium]